MNRKTHDLLVLETEKDLYHHFALAVLGMMSNLGLEAMDNRSMKLLKLLDEDLDVLLREYALGPLGFINPTSISINGITKVRVLLVCPMFREVLAEHLKPLLPLDALVRCTRYESVRPGRNDAVKARAATATASGKNDTQRTVSHP